VRRLTLVVLALVAVAAASAQVTAGSILGTVRDQTGAVVPNARVVVTDTRKGTSVTVEANGDREYTIPFLIPETVDGGGLRQRVDAGHVQSDGIDPVEADDVGLVSVTAHELAAYLPGIAVHGHGGGVSGS
jgi:hypothetical protein